MDAPHLLDAEWKRNNVMRKIGQFYDSVWVYGPPDFYDPLIGLDVPAAVRAKMDFVGFLQRSVSTDVESDHKPEGRLHPGHHRRRRRRRGSVHDVIDAYQEDPTLTHKALIVLGPYMPAEAAAQADHARCEASPISR